MRRLILALLGVALVVSPASANPQTTLDRDDTAGPLDLVAGKQNNGFIAQTHPNRSWMVLGGDLRRGAFARSRGRFHDARQRSDQAP